MITQSKFPFSTEELRNELKHTFWLLNRVDSAKALAKKLEQHPVFGEYKIILAAGDGIMDGLELVSEEESRKSFDKVVYAVKNYEKTITLSVGQLTTGVTIPEWTAVLMLSNVKSPSLYMQAAFRTQNPCLFAKDGEFYRKKNAYVFDFDPARTLMIFEEFANDLSAKTSDGRGDAGTRKENVKELLNFFPVIGEDEDGEMVELDAEKVLSIPRKIRSQEVVRRGFMSNFLFQNISHVFHAPQEVIDIITSFTPVQELGKKADITPDTQAELSLDDNGEVSLEEGYVIGKSAELFGEKVYGTIPDKLNDVISDMRSSTRNQMERRLKDETDSLVNKAFGNYKIEANTIEKEKQDALDNCVTTNKSEEEVNQEFDRRQEEAASRLQETLNSSISDFVKSASEEVVRTVETSKEKFCEDSGQGKTVTLERALNMYMDEYYGKSVQLGTALRKIVQ